MPKIQQYQLLKLNKSSLKVNYLEKLKGKNAGGKQIGKIFGTLTYAFIMSVLSTNQTISCGGFNFVVDGDFRPLVKIMISSKMINDEDFCNEGNRFNFCHQFQKTYETPYFTKMRLSLQIQVEIG